MKRSFATCLAWLVVVVAFGHRGSLAMAGEAEAIVAVEKLGGKVLHKKTEIPGMGWFGIFHDPTGNVLALYTSMNPENK